jgi:hypothetical protein
MKWLKKRNIICCPEHMEQCMDIMSQEPGKHKHRLAPDVRSGAIELGEVYLFRSGAKLARDDVSRWHIYGYTAGDMDGHAAEYELRAADHVRQALSLMKSVDAVLRTPTQFCIKYEGLYGAFPSGQRSPSKLNYTPRITRKD